MTTPVVDTTAAVKDPRDLVPPETWQLVTDYYVATKHVTLPYAEQAFGQLIVWIKALGADPTTALAMSEAVDEAWHLFMEFSLLYTETTTALYGGYLHHIPPPPGKAADPDAAARTVPALKATGYRVLPEFWIVMRSCCPPNPPQPGKADNGDSSDR